MYIMSKARIMGAGSSGSNYGVNKNSPGNGNGKWQGLWPSVGHAKNARLINNETNANVRLASRTDRGVGAIYQVVSLFTDHNPIIAEINSYLPNSIRGLGYTEVSKDFNLPISIRLNNSSEI